MRKKLRLAAASVAMALFAGGLVAAQSIVGAPARADSGDIWHVPDNVALLAEEPGSIAVGAAYSPLDASGAPVSFSNFQNGTIDLALKSSSLAYFLFKQGSLTTNWIGGALHFGRLFAFGSAYAWGSGLPAGGELNLGLLVRPASFASLGLTLNAGPGSPVVYGIGAALRPLAFIPRLGPWLTLTADAQIQGDKVQLQDAGAHVSINRWLGIRGWYDFQNNGVGLEATLALGATRDHASVPSVANPGAFTLGESLSFTPGRPPSHLPFGKKILVIKGLDAIIHGQSSVGFITRLLGTSNTVSFRGLVQEVKRAAKDRSVEAVVLENLPSLGGPASVEEFTHALGAARKAGKRVYVFASEYLRSFQFQMIASQANWVAVSPAGSVNLSGRSVRRLYLKDFFDRIGLHFVNLAPWKTKSAFNNFSESAMSSAERDMLLRYEGNLQKQALDAFARGRGARLRGKPQAVLDAGPFLSAQRALKEGVVDGLEYRDAFQARVKKQLPGAAFITSLPKPESGSWGSSLLTKRVAVVNLTGDIVLGRGSAGASIGTDAVRLLERLRKDKSIAAILLRVDSPGGVMVTGDEIAHQVKEAVAAGKPVVVSLGDYGASGGYYISAYATRIFAEPGTITGSIGVTGLLPNFSGALAKLGIHSSGVELSPSAGMLDPRAPFSERDLALAHEAILNDYARFVSVVASGRKMSPARVREIGKGQVWTGQEALANGLVDALGGLDAAKAYLRGKLGGEVSFEGYSPGQPSSFSSLLAPVLGSLGRSALIDATGGAQSGEGVAALLKAARPYAQSLANVLSMGSGPLYYFDRTQGAF